MAYAPYRAALKRFLLPLDRAAHARKVAVALGLSKPAKSRLEWMFWHDGNGQNALLTSRRFGVAPKTFWKWRKRYLEHGPRGLTELSRRPLKRKERATTPLQTERIVALKRANIRYGKAKITALYEAEYNERVSQWKVQKVIEARKLYYHPAKNARTQAKRRKAQKKKRISELRLKKRRGFLFRIDTVVRYWHGTKRFILTAVDSASRLAFTRMYTTHSSRVAADFLRRLHALVDGRIENVQTDNGSEFHGEFEKACGNLGIAHYWSRVRTPKDNGQNERFNRTLSEEFIQMGNAVVDPAEFNRRLTEWLVEYNFRRPHQALGYLSPINFIYRHEKLLPMYPSSTPP
jgi:transposase InsO family protein